MKTEYDVDDQGYLIPKHKGDGPRDPAVITNGYGLRVKHWDYMKISEKFNYGLEKLLYLVLAPIGSVLLALGIAYVLGKQ